MGAKRAVLALAAATLLTLGVGPRGTDDVGETELPGLTDAVLVLTDADGVRHLGAQNDFDLALAQGFVHCRDRLFQMDQTRRQIDGTESELLGPGRLGSDIQARIIGLHRAAQRSFDAAPTRFQALLQAYADGVNHCIDALEQTGLPPEYGLLELTQVRPWEAVDSLKIGKGIAASLSLDVDTGLTEDLLAFITAGISGGFDGQLFFSEDVFRSAPMDPASTIPDATNRKTFTVNWNADPELLASVAAASRRVRERLEGHPLFDVALNRRESFVGSNEWGVTGSRAQGGMPIIANDPHLSLNMPSTFYEWHLVVTDDPDEGPMNVNGVGFPGTPGVILGQTAQGITWGATTNPMDVSDVFLDTLHVAQPQCFLIGALACIESPPGVFHGVDLQLGVTYFFNLIGDAIDDNLVQATGLPREAEIIGTVPFRSFGPIIDITDSSVLEPPFGTSDALVLQYTGFHATGELEAFSIWNRAQNLGDFLAGLDKFDAGSQNWAYADVDGNLGYFSSAELPLRTDLESGTVIGLPPFFVRDGKSGFNNWVPDPAHSQGQAIPFDILPYAEMPQILNPANHFFVNANNDPAGTSLDNDPLNQMRPGKPGAIYYLNPGYAIGMRAGRITRLIESHRKVGVKDMKRFQANTQQLDAELMRPFLLEAFNNANAGGAPTELSELASDPDIIEAIGRLAAWDFSTPTGIPEGYDADDRDGFRRPSVRPREAAASVAATIYNMWRGQAIRRIVRARLVSLGLGGALPGSSGQLKALHHLLSQDPYTGIAAAGIDWIPAPLLAVGFGLPGESVRARPYPAAMSAEERRDLALLQALRDGLDALASPEFAPAFGESTDQDDYRWGKLHRIRFDHPFHDPFDVPPQNGFEDVGPGLRGVARDGGYNVVNASGFAADAIGLNAFDFGGGPVRRYVGRVLTGPPEIRAFNAIPGGPSGIPGTPEYTTQLGSWLTADYHRVNMRLRTRGGGEERLVPPAP